MKLASQRYMVWVSCLLAVAIIPVATLSLGSSCSFVSKRPLILTKTRPSIPSNKNAHLTMRDASASYWFQVGDSVKVVADDVEKAGINLQHRIGTVIETWEKCDVDPTCCCAEQVDINMAVRVEFQGSEADPTALDESFRHYFAEEELIKVKTPTIQEDDTIATVVTPGSSLGMGRRSTAFTRRKRPLQAASQPSRHGLGNWEPVSQPPPQQQHQDPLFEDNTTTDTVNPLPFDGMTCGAFKINHLESASQKPRGLAKWEPAAQPQQREDASSEGDASNDVQPVVPFDGMSCGAFKINHLQSASQQPRGISAWEPVSQTQQQQGLSEDLQLDTTGSANPLPFDGMSCGAFKINHLQSASQKPRGLAKWEPVSQRPSEEYDQ